MNDCKFILGMLISVIAVTLLAASFISYHFKLKQPEIISKNKPEFLVIVVISLIMGLILMFI